MADDSPPGDPVVEGDADTAVEASDDGTTAGTGDGTVPDGSRLGDVVVRRFEPGDREAVLDLHRRALRETGTDPADVPGTGDLRSVRESYLDGGGEFLVAERSGEVVAMGGLRVDGVRPDAETAAGELFRMRVAPAHQREGLGTAILDGLEAAARERGLDRLTLTTARRQTAATEFYPANGYAAVGRESHGEYDLIRFEKDL